MKKFGFVLLGIFVVVALLGGFVVADNVVRDQAETRVQEQLVTKFSAPEGQTQAGVKLNGFPFLAYLVTHKVKSGTISASNVYLAEDDLTIAQADFDFTDLYNPKSGPGKVGSAQGTLVLSYDELTKQSGTDEFTMRYAGNERVEAKTSVDMFGTPAEITMSFGLKIEGNVLSYVDPKISVSGLDIPQSLLDSALSEEDLSTELPNADGLKYESVTLAEEGIIINVSATDWELPE